MQEASDKKVDVVVIGLGAMGSMTLWRLAARGASVVGFEQFDLAHDQGSSHGDSRIIRTAYFENPRYVPLVQRSFKLWHQLEQESGAKLVTMTGALMIGRPDSPIVAGTLASTREHDLVHEVLDARQMRERYPMHRLAPDEIAVYEEAGGVLHPEAAIMAAGQRAEALGATIHRRTKVERLQVEATGARVTAAGVTYNARHVVVAVGPWLGEFLPELRLPLQVERQVVAWFPMRRPELYSPERFPVYVHDIGRSNMYGIPTLDGRSLKAAVHHEGALTDVVHIDRSVHTQDLAPIQQFVCNYLSDVEPTALRSQVCMYTNTPDSDFLVGRVPALQSMIVLGGFSGHGFKFAPVVGDVAADLALTGKTSYPVDFFNLERFVKRE